MKKNTGFSLIEFVVVIILLGVLSALVLPRLNLDTFRETGGFQQGTAMIRFGQKLAITSGCQVNVSLSSASCTIAFDVGSSCGASNIPNPSTGNNNFCTDSDPGVSPAVAFSFNNIGAPTGGLQTVNFGSGQTVTVEANTGFVHE